MLIRRMLAALACLVCLVVFGMPVFGELTIWTEHATKRVCRSEKPPTSVVAEAHLAGARNEWVSFQVFFRGDQAVSGLAISLGALVGPDKKEISAEQVRIYREHQLELKVGTYRNDGFQPDWYPDPLIPVTHPMTNQPLTGGRLVAQPFDLPANETHGFWIDIYVPRGIPEGVYRGQLVVKTAVGQTAAIPVTVEVWDFTLPQTPAMTTALGSPAERMRDYYAKRAKEGKEPEPADWVAVEKQCAALAKEHRINAYPPSGWLRLVRTEQGFQLPPDNITRLREWIDTYSVNAIQVPSPTHYVKDPQANAGELNTWAAAWDAAIEAVDRPHVVWYIYLRDEPNDPEAYEFVRQWGKPIRATGTKVKVMVVEQTLTQDPSWGDLYGAVDIWCSLFPLYDEPTARQRQSLGEIIWVYTALCQGKRKTPWWHIDYPLLNYRVPCWMAWRYGVWGILYWGGMSYWAQVEDPWADPRTYRPGSPDRPTIYNGEGTLVYPARPCGYDGIVSSLRLKALRDGIEDFDYFQLLEKAGQSDVAMQIVQRMTPSWFEWSEDAAAYEAARAELARAILSLPPEKRN